MDNKEDLSISASMGYIMHELETKGPCTKRYFTDGINTQDLNDMTNAIHQLQRQGDIMIKDAIIYIPTKFIKDST